jgi:hypothetical protein
MKRKRNERYKNDDKTQRDVIYRYKLPPQYIPFLRSHPNQQISNAVLPPTNKFYIDGVLPPGDTFFWNSPKKVL